MIAGTPVTAVTAGSTYSFSPTSGDADGDRLVFGIDAKPSWATFDTATGQLRGTPAANDAAVYRGVVVWVTDGTAVTALPAFDVVVTSALVVNREPQISGTPSVSVLAGNAYTFTPTATDPDHDPLAFTISGKPAWASFDSTNGRLEGTPPAGVAGLFPGIVISTTDGSSAVSLAAFDIVVTVPALNAPPVISGVPPSTVEAGNVYVFVPTASDPNNDGLTFAVQQLPPWATFDTQTGRLSGTPPAGTSQTFAGIVISVTDGSLTAVLAVFSITVTAPTPNRVPVITGSPLTSVVEGAPYAFQPLATDADNDPLRYGISNKPSWATFSDVTGLLQGTPGAGDVRTYGNVVINVTDGQATAELPAFAITVASANKPPTISGVPPSIVTAGQAYLFHPIATDPNLDSLTYAIDHKPSWAAFDTVTGHLEGTPAPATDFGTFAGIVISVSDGRATNALPPFSILVNRAPEISGTPPSTGAVGEPYSFTPTVTDLDFDQLIFSIVNPPPWMTSFSTTTGQVQGTPGIANVGTYNGILITVNDGHTTRTLPLFSITVPVPNAPPLISGTPDTSVAAGAAYSFEPTAGDSNGDPLTFGIDAKPAWAVFDTATGRLSGTPVASDAGTYRGIVVSVTDGIVVTSLPAFDLIVTSPSVVNRVPQISGTPPLSVVAGNAYTFTPTASDPDNDPLAFTIQSRPSWASFDSTNGKLEGMPQAADAGTFPGIVISVTDGPATVSLEPFDLVVTVPALNRVPVISGSPPTAVEAGNLYVFVPTAGDPDNDALTFAIQQLPAWAAFDTQTGRLSGTPPAGIAQTFTDIVISVSDGSLTAVLPAFSIAVTAPTPNRVPVISGSPPITVVEGAAYAFQPVATDADNDPLTYTIANAPVWATFSSATGMLQGTPAAADVGTYDNVVISVTDGNATAALPAFAITVTSSNESPVISGVPPSIVTAGQVYLFQPTASDPDVGDVLTYSIANSPAWATFDTMTGRLHGTPAAANFGTFANIVISVSDGADTDALPAFSIFVNRPPEISGTPPSIGAVGAVYSFTPTASDPDVGATLIFSIANPPSWVTSFSTGTGQLQGTPGAADVGTVANIVIAVSDGHATRALPAFSITIPVPNAPPLISGTPDTSVAAGTAYSFTPTASDPNPGTTLVYSIVNQPAWAVFSTSSGVLTGTPAASHIGTTSNIVISVSDGLMSTSLAAFSIAVTNTPPVISGTPATSVVAGEAYSFTPTASDANPGTTLVYSIANQPAWATFSTSTGALTGTPVASHIGGVNGILISVTDGVASASLGPFSIAVTNTAPLISGTPSTSVAAGAPYSFTPTASDANPGTTLTFGVANAPAWATFNSATGELRGTPATLDTGTTTAIAISVSDGVTSTPLTPFSVTVTNAPPVISGTPATGVAAGEAYSFTPMASDPNAGTTLTYSIVNQPAWAAFSTSTGALTGTPVASHIGTTNGIVISVTDGLASAPLAAFSIAVMNTAPVISGTPAASVAAGDAYAFTPTANDSNPGTTLTFSINQTPPWATFSTTTGTVTGTPATSHTGTYSNLVISVSDGHDSTPLAAFSITVTNAPPVISGTPATSVVAGAAYAFTPTGSDPNAGTTLTYSIVNQPAWATFGTNTGALTGAPVASDIGTTNGIVISVSDGLASASLAAFSIAVTNTAPLISGTPAASVAVGAAYSFTPTASDPNPGTTLTFSVVNSPAWAAFSTATGQLQGTPATSDTGIHSNIGISVSDGVTSTPLTPFSITVTNTPPVISGTPATSVVAGAAYSFTPTASDANPGTTLTYSIVNAPSWATFSTMTGALTGTPTASHIGTTNGIVISVSDGNATTPLAAFSIAVTNTPPVISGTPATSVAVGATYSFTPTADDSNPGTTLAFSIVNKPSWATFSTTTGALTGIPATANTGTTNGIAISVTDGHASTPLATFSITVTNSPPLISGTPAASVAAGTAYSFTPTASDPNAGTTLTFSINTTPPWATFNSTNGRLQGTPATAHTGPYSNLIISVTDGNATTPLAPFTITVTNAAPLISGTPPATAIVGSPYTFTPTASDANLGTTLTFNLSPATPAWATFNTATGQLQGTPTAGDVGSYSNLVITVSDGVAQAALPPFTVTVQAVATGSAQMTWIPPTQNTDGTPLTNLAGYKFYWGPALGNYPSSRTEMNPGLTTYVIENLAPGTYFFVVTAINSAMVESQFSNAASKVVPP